MLCNPLLGNPEDISTRGLALALLVLFIFS